jgi:poly-beta-1,6-N-acetyl-D-glucosamine biosynthesis protein PgaD
MSAGPYWSRPDLHRLAELSITTLFWLAWFYLITPLLSLVMWLAGIRMFVDEMLVQDGYIALLVELRTYGMIILGMLLIMLAWVEWNVQRYGRHNHRLLQPEPVTNREIAQHAGLTEKVLATLHESRMIIVDYDDQDKLLVRNMKRKKTKGPVRGP